MNPVYRTLRNFLASLAVASTLSVQAGESIKVGQIVALTGATAAWGIPEHNAVKDEVARINAKGGVLGRQIELIAYDFKADQLEGVNVAKRLIGDGVVAIIGPGSSGTAIAITAVTEAAGIPIVTTAATNPKVTYNFDRKAVIRTAFRACFIDPFQGSVAAKFATADLKAKKAAVLFDVGSDYSQGLDQYFRNAFEKFGGRIVAREGFRSGEVDFRAILGKIKNAGADVIYTPTDMPQAAMLMKQARALGIKSTFISGDNCDTPDILPLAGDAAEGCYFTNIASLDDPTIKTWIAEYQKSHGTLPLLPNCVMAVDATRALCQAIIKANSTEPRRIIENLELIKDFPVLTGSLTIDPQTHNPVNKPCVIEAVRNGRIVFVKRVVKVD